MNRVGKLLHWLLNGFDPVGYLVREDLSDVLGRTREKENLVGMTREERARKRQQIKVCEERLHQLQEELLQDGAGNPRGEGRFRYLVVETREIRAEDSFDALQRVHEGEGRPIIVQTEQFPIGKSAPKIAIVW